MKPDIKMNITVGTFRSLTTAQFEALKNNVLADGCWETSDSVRVSGGGDYIGVEPMRQGARDIFIGIERDGYTHS